MWYVNKAIILKGFKIIKAHIIDDDCNEFIALIKGDFIHSGYYGVSELNIVDLEEYDRCSWCELMDAIEYSVNVERIFC